jgi:anti-sigma regulatory factor (Ser/Thr protein kinase)
MSAVKTMTAAVLDFEMPCDLSQVRSAGEKARAFLTVFGWPPQEVMDCELALVEACNNAIKYVRREARNLPVIVRVVSGSSDIELRITDHTPGFDWPQQASPPNPAAESGRGVFLIQTLMDQTLYLRRSGENVLVLRKLISPP